MIDLKTSVSDFFPDLNEKLGIAIIEKLAWDAIKLYTNFASLGVGSLEHSTSAELETAELDNNPLNPVVSMTFRGQLKLWFDYNVPGIEDSDLPGADGSLEATYNLTTGKYNLNLTIKFNHGLGEIELNEETLSELLDGQLNGLLELLPHQDIIVRQIKSNYDRLKAKYEAQYGGPGNVYLASEKFVRWAGADMVGKEVLKGAVSQGATVEATMEKVKKEALKELGNVAEWIQNRIQTDVGEAASKLLSGASLAEINIPEIKLLWQEVTYWSTLAVGGRQVGGEFATVPHLAFAIVWDKPAATTFPPPTTGDSVPPVIPDNRTPDPATPAAVLPHPMDQGSIDPAAVHNVTFKNAISVEIRAKTIKFSNQSPQSYTTDLQPNTASAPVLFNGGSTRGIAMWRLSDHKLIGYQPAPIYNNLQIDLKATGGMPHPEDIGSANSNQFYCVRFRNKSARNIRIKTIKCDNIPLSSLSTDMPPDTQSFGFRFGGGSTRLFAVYDLASGMLLKLVPQPVYNNQWFIYSEVSEIVSGVAVLVSLFEARLPDPGDDFSISDAANG